jgi:hypothetical protein
MIPSGNVLACFATDLLVRPSGCTAECRKTAINAITRDNGADDRRRNG